MQIKILTDIEKLNMTEEQIVIGVPKIVDNANSLLKDADLLYNEKRYERAFSIYQLSIEEIAKAFFLINVVLFDELSKPEIQTRIKKEIKNHKFKIHKSIGLQSLVNSFFKDINMETYENLVIESFEEMKNIDITNNKKNWGFYTSFKNNIFQSPRELIKDKDVSDIKKKASFLVSFGTILIYPICINYDKIKIQIKELNFDKNKCREEQIEELSRIKKKYNYK